MAETRVQSVEQENFLMNEFDRFREYHPAQRLSRNMRSLLLEFLSHENSVEAEYLQELMIDLDGLFTLLDAIEMSQKREFRNQEA